MWNTVSLFSVSLPFLSHSLFPLVNQCCWCEFINTDLKPKTPIHRKWTHGSSYTSEKSWPDSIYLVPGLKWLSKNILRNFYFFFLIKNVCFLSWMTKIILSIGENVWQEPHTTDPNSGNLVLVVLVIISWICFITM